MTNPVALRAALLNNRLSKKKKKNVSKLPNKCASDERNETKRRSIRERCGVGRLEPVRCRIAEQLRHRRPRLNVCIVVLFRLFVCLF
jgi:hypothetical protein